ncbi:hypothetical protein FS837_002201 [Tulasnella sp. UAMH 9824]|nr:hypothetical protein FS837_002201 [Tulasnella sp. UAMH 9824]
MRVHSTRYCIRDISKVRPVRNRSVLVSFSGSLWGTGILDRMKLICSRPGGENFNHIPNRRLFTSLDPLRTLLGSNGNYSYKELINDTIFCAQPAGTTGWATRLIDTMYSGCIPVFIGESALRPFHDIIDWSNISVRISAGDINRIEEILFTRYSLEDLEKMQAKIMLVRDALLYPLDDISPGKIQEQMIDRRGPLWFALQSTRMRMLTKWPMDDVYDGP